MGNSALAFRGRGKGWTRRARLTAFAALTAVVATAFVALEPTRADAAGSPCGTTINPIVCENSKPGTSPSVWDIAGAGDDSIQGYATDISVNAGSTVGFKIDTNASSYKIDIYRTGWYQGLGARFIQSVSPSATLPQNQPQCISDVTTELYDCGTWAVSASWNVPSTAVSGVYIAKLTRNDNGDASHIIFVVRNDGNTSEVLFQTSDPTWHAYNTYGGSDFYQGAGNGRAYKISYNRPFNTRGGVEARDFYFGSEYATVRFLERNGYDMSYIAGVDTDRRGGELKNHKVFLSVGHDEYWSGAQRANIAAARDAGVNLQFLTGNEGYWRTRYENSVDGSHTSYRTLVSYKETWSNAKIDPSSEWTGTWRDPRFAGASQGGTLPENALTGTMYMINDVDLPVTVSAAEGKTRLWRNTSLTSLATGTSAALAAHTVGYESNEDIDNGFRPAGLIRLSTTTGSVSQYLTDYGSTVVAGTTRHHVTLYKAASGALVFSAGSVQWGWGLDSTHDGNGAPADIRMQQAQVNLLADMGAQPGSRMSGLVAATKTSDITAPTTAITAPAAGTAIASGSSVTVTGTASDAGRVGGVEVSTDGGVRWHPATGTTNWSYTYLQQGVGAASIRARAIDDSGNFAANGVSRAITVNGPYSALGNAVPAIAAANDSQAVELGLRITPDRDGFIAGVRFYKGAGNTGQHVGSLWDSAGARLATVTFTNETATGWQSAQFVQPVAVVAGQTYTVSYTAPVGRYSFQERYWPYVARKSSPVGVTSGVAAAAPGVYAQPGTFPTSTYGEANYFVDALFTTSDSSPLRISTRTPIAGSSSIAPDTQVTATFTRAADPATVSLTVAGSTGSAVQGTVSYDAATRTARFAPATAFAPSTTYTVAPAAKDTAGVALEAGSGWTFTTRAADTVAGQCPCSLFNESRTPTILSEADAASVTLGVGFTPNVAGTITAIKFYKGISNTGTHTGALWDNAGAKLADVTFTGESTTGWQVAQLNTPVAVQAGTRYVASYVAPNGRYSTTPGAFSSAYTRGPLTVAASGAVFTYSTGFPSQTSATDYGVDVVFQPAAAAPLVVSQTPAPGATGISATATLTATFSAPIQSGFTGTVTAAGSPVAGSWTLSTDARTATFTPTAPHAAGAQVTATLSGVKGTNGASAATTNWSFTVAGGTSSAVTLLGTMTPSATETSDAASVELGMAFTSSVGGQVTAIRFYKAASNTGTHVGSLWSATGQRLAQVTFAGETASGWQRATLSTPVTLTAGAVYTVSYLAPQGNYSYTSAGFASAVTNGPLTAVSPDNGRYRYGSGGVAPTASWNSTNYFVDVEFVPTSGGTQPALAVESMTPARAATGVATNTTVSATLNRDAAGQTVGLTLAGPGGTVAGSASYSAAAKRVTFTPAAALAQSSTYTATVTIDGLALDSWTFQTVEPPTSGTAQNLFGTATPAVPTVTDTAAVEVGTAFTVAKAGNATAIRFYKGTGNTGTHRGTLWGPAGQVLAQVTFTNETASGWQRAALSTPVALQTGTTYTVSYFSPGGKYSYTSGYFSQQRVSGDITAPATTNGRFVYGANGGYPTASWNATAYFVDAEIDFGATPPAEALRQGATEPAPVTTATPSPAPTPTPTTAPSSTPSATPSPSPTPSARPVPSVAKSSVSPASAATNVAPTTPASVVLNADVSAAQLALAGPAGAVLGASDYDSATRTVTFTPTAPLAWSTVYTATVSATGATVDDASWSFTTAAAPELKDAATIFGDAPSPNPGGTQVATRFTVDVAGAATGMRFYNGTTDAGQGTGYLWNANGEKLAEVEFSAETVDGWRTAVFTTPVQLKSGVAYRVGLHSTSGQYAVALNALASPTAVGHVITPADGGAYTHSRNFPDSLSPHNFWVNVTFAPAE